MVLEWQKYNKKYPDASVQWKARIFCIVRGYIFTARKNSMTSIKALTILFNENMPDFIKQIHSLR